MSDAGKVVHRLKIWPEYFCRVEDGSKTFEVRVNDRGFQCGGLVRLLEFDPREGVGKHTGKELSFQIGYVLPIDDKRVVFSLLPLKESPSHE